MVGASKHARLHLALSGKIDGLLWLCPGIVSYTEFSLRGQRTRSRDEGKRSRATNHQVCTKAELERCLGRSRGCGLCDRVAWKGTRADKECGRLCQPWRAAMAGIHCLLFQLIQGTRHQTGYTRGRL